jgi:hypothetical protein
MDTASFCAYNVTRNALLSEQVTSVSKVQDSAQLLALVLNGPGRDPKSAVRLTSIESALEMPRIFAFDIAYLDDEHRIVEAAGVGPGTPLPSLATSVASILFLSDQCLAKSGTAPGDIIKICTEAELAVLLRAASQSRPADPLPQAIPPEEGLDLRKSTESFDGSLIYLPSLGTPQSSEFFLPIQAPRPHLPDLSNEHIIQLTPVELPPSEAQVANGPVPIEPPELPSKPTSNRDEEFEEPRQIPPAPVHFFVPPTVTEAHGAKQAEPIPEAEPPHPPQLSYLSPQLKAIIQQVDEQLRREKNEQEGRTRPEETPEEKTEPASSHLKQPLDSARVEEARTGLQQQAAPQAENAVTGSSIGNAQESNETRAAAANNFEPAPAEPLADPQSRTDKVSPTPFHKVSRNKVSRKVRSASAHQRDKLRTATPADSHARSEPAQPVVPPPVRAQETPRVPDERRSDKALRATLARSKEKTSFATRVQRWLAGESISLSGNRRRGQRISIPGLVAFYWTGGAPTPHEIVNISHSGLYLRSKEMWSPDTVLRMTLERPDAEEGERKSIAVLARVVRSDEGGVAHEFITTDVLENLRARDFLAEQGTTNRKKLEKFLELN